MKILNNTRHCELADSAVFADTSLARMKGLLGRHALKQGEGLIIRPCQSVHMFFMRFSIDVIFVDKVNIVVGLCPNLRPFNLSPIFWKSACAIELPAGTIERTSTAVGDQISW